MEATTLSGSRIWTRVDAAFEAFLAGAAADLSARWLLVQTLATAVSRRTLLATLGMGPGWRVLDVGTGFGAVPMELATLQGVATFGVDRDSEVLGAAARISGTIAASGGFAPGASVSFGRGDVFALPCRTSSFDAAVARFVYEHLANTAAATAELARVVKPGGLVCVIDVDDGLSISYPEPSEAFSRLASALAAQQRAAGGDRQVGRKLAGILDAGGFDVTNVVILPQAAYGASTPTDLGRRLVMERFRIARPGIIELGLISEDEFEEHLERFGSETPTQCQIEGHMAVLARRRS